RFAADEDAGKLAPAARAYHRIALDDPAGERQHQRERVIGDGVGHRAGRVGDDDSGGGGGGEVHAVNTNAAARDDLEPWAGAEEQPRIPRRRKKNPGLRRALRFQLRPGLNRHLVQAMPLPAAELETTRAPRRTQNLESPSLPDPSPR